MQWAKKSKGYQKDPMSWLKERMGENPDTVKWSTYPEYENHKFDGSRDPLYNAWMDLVNGHFVALESATGTGKTYIASRMVYWFLDCFPNSLVVTVGPSTSQLKDNLWAELGNAFGKFEKCRTQSRLLIGELRVIDNPKKKNWHAIMRSGSGDSKSDEEKASAKISGFHRKYMLFIIDEMQGVSKEVLETLENTCTGETNYIVGFGNPDHDQDTLHKFCIRQDVKHYIVSGLDHPNVVVGKEIIAGAVTRKSIERREIKYGKNSPFFLSRVRGICPSYSMTDLFNLDMFDHCCNNGVEIDNSSSALGIDPSNSEDGDEACAVYGMANFCMAIFSFQCPDCNLIADNVIYSDSYIESEHGKEYVYNLPKINDFDIKAHNIGVDNIGVGIGTMNRFKNEHKKIVGGLNGSAKQDLNRVPKDRPGKKGKPLYTFGNLRAQMIYQLAHDINNGFISFVKVKNFNALDRIRKAMRYTKLIVVNGKTFATPKEDIVRYVGHSPNDFDAVMYWNWIRNVKQRTSTGSVIWDVEN